MLHVSRASSRILYTTRSRSIAGKRTTELGVSSCTGNYQSDRSDGVARPVRRSSFRRSDLRLFGRSSQRDRQSTQLDSDAVTQAKIAQDLPQLGFHGPGESGINVYRELNAHAESVARAQLGQDLGAKPVPHLGGTVPEMRSVVCSASGAGSGPGRGSGWGSGSGPGVGGGCGEGEPSGRHCTDEDSVSRRADSRNSWI